MLIKNTKPELDLFLHLKQGRTNSMFLQLKKKNRSRLKCEDRAVTNLATRRPPNNTKRKSLKMALPTQQQKLPKKPKKMKIRRTWYRSKKSKMPILSHLSYLQKIQSKNGKSKTLRCQIQRSLITVLKQRKKCESSREVSLSMCLSTLGINCWLTMFLATTSDDMTNSILIWLLISERAIKAQSKPTLRVK
jgi:hypothetical protein